MVNTMYLIIDCETTGLPRNWKASPRDVDNWPRAIQIAWELCDESGKQVESVTRLIQPAGFSIPGDVQRIHGITTERALAEGEKLIAVLQELSAAAAKAAVIIGHNVKFDQNVISAEYYRLQLKPPFEDKRRICTMTASTDLCRIPGPYGYKWPTLSQLHEELFKSGYEEAHDAGADVAACAKCFFELKRRGVISS